ncbi:MAG: pectin esterase [Saprospiraceae bacterium]|nr:pectin esterase [Saprospiraceae bacterium]
MRIYLFSISLILFSITIAYTNEPYRDITVATDGSGDYKTLTDAIHNLPMYTYERVIIYIKKGIYNEKIRIEQDNITLLGEDKDSTIIQYSQLREDWQKNKDFIGPAVINIHADDIILKNLTIINTQPQLGPHAFTIYGIGTRTILYNCKVLSKGGDTVSLWNYKEGMYYHAKCEFEGGVDFVCPRGWCYITDSRFYELQRTATIWHAATTEETQRLVIRNSYFDGVEGFHLGRHHYDAAFYLLNCIFSNAMADKPIYHVTYPDEPERNRPYFWGDRYYFDNCKKEGNEFTWLQNNLKETGVSANNINASWTFDGKWNPESIEAPKIKNWEIKNNSLLLHFSEPLTIRGKPILKTYNGKELIFIEGRGRDTLRFSSNLPVTKKDFKKELRLSGGKILATQASLEEKFLPETIQLSSNH